MSEWGANQQTVSGVRADLAQAEHFHALLAAKRAELCDLLDEYAVRLAPYERTHQTAGVRRKLLRIKEIGAEICDIDRMMHTLKGRLVGVRQEPRSV